MKTVKIVSWLLFMSLMMTTSGVWGQGINKREVCFFVSKISLPTVTGGSLATCASSANPAACELALWAINCSGNPICAKSFEVATNEGCKLTITLVGEAWEISATAVKGTAEEMRRISQEAKEVYEELNKVSGMIWLQRYLSHR
ncbi:MAG: hypothetical protein AAFQ83_17455 [Bacteroidota bacterium]